MVMVTDSNSNGERVQYLPQQQTSEITEWIYFRGSGVIMNSEESPHPTHSNDLSIITNVCTKRMSDLNFIFFVRLHRGTTKYPDINVTARHGLVRFGFTETDKRDIEMEFVLEFGFELFPISVLWSDFLDAGCQLFAWHFLVRT